jgi:magnesium-transporting ATPase (P-type)
MTSNEKRFMRVVLIGIYINVIFFVLPLVFAPGWLLGLLKIPLDELIWARATGMLLFIISIFYLPATWDIKRYRANAWFHILPSRTFGSTFFFVAVVAFDYPIGYLSIAVVDGIFGALSLWFLIGVTREEKASGNPVALR